MHEIEWETKRDGLYAKHYLLPLMKHGVKRHIQNVNTQLYLLEIDDIIMPVTVNDKEFDNSYVCSPYTHYVSYAKEELWELGKPSLEKGLSKVIDGLGYVLRKTPVNRMVVVNNWLLSTNLYFPLSYAQLQTITTLLTKQFPTHTIAFRSLNKVYHQEMCASLNDLAYEAVMSRSVYLFDPAHFKTLNKKKRKDYLNDKRLLKQTSYEIVEHASTTEETIQALKKWYDALYIQKYSPHNPQFTLGFFRNAYEHQLMEFKLLKRNDEIYGMVGYFHRNGTLTTPFVGYDTDNDKEEGLYRLLTFLATQKVLEENYLGHFSAGAGQFKRNRGAVQAIEYTYIYQQHLSKKDKRPWRFLKWIMDRWIEPMAKKSKF